jgi:hypothetical protein
LRADQISRLIRYRCQTFRAPGRGIETGWSAVTAIVGASTPARCRPDRAMSASAEVKR